MKTPINQFVYFSQNYNFGFIAEAFKDSHTNLAHLQSKFDSAYNRRGSSGVMLEFYLQLDSENQTLLENYIINNYKNG